MEVQPKNRTIAKGLTTSTADLYVVPSNYEAEIVCITVSNITDNTRYFTLEWVDTSDTVTTIFAKDTEIKKNSIFQMTEAFWLHKGDKIRGSADVNTSININIRVGEYFVPQQI